MPGSPLPPGHSEHHPTQRNAHRILSRDSPSGTLLENGKSKKVTSRRKQHWKLECNNLVDYLCLIFCVGEKTKQNKTTSLPLGHLSRNCRIPFGWNLENFVSIQRGSSSPTACLSDSRAISIQVPPSTEIFLQAGQPVHYTVRGFKNSPDISL